VNEAHFRHQEAESPNSRILFDKTSRNDVYSSCLLQPSNSVTVQISFFCLLIRNGIKIQGGKRFKKTGESRV
jgi:hypothetical protein